MTDDNETLTIVLRARPTLNGWRVTAFEQNRADRFNAAADRLLWGCRFYQARAWRNGPDPKADYFVATSLTKLGARFSMARAVWKIKRKVRRDHREKLKARKHLGQAGIGTSLAVDLDRGTAS